MISTRGFRVRNFLIKGKNQHYFWTGCPKIGVRGGELNFSQKKKYFF